MKQKEKNKPENMITLYKQKGLTIENINHFLDKQISEAEAEELLDAIKMIAHVILEIQYKQESEERNNKNNNYKQAA